VSKAGSVAVMRRSIPAHKGATTLTLDQIKRLSHLARDKAALGTPRTPRQDGSRLPMVLVDLDAQDNPAP
jgi:hypothetical protein